MSAFWPMVSAEVLKLRRRFGLFWGCLVITVGGVILVNLLEALGSTTDGDPLGRLGGYDSLNSTLPFLGVTTGIASLLIGAAVATSDTSSGVFRYLAVTGRSRLQLALVRIPGALLVLLPMVYAGFLLEVLVGFGMAGGSRPPDAALVLAGAGWLLAIALFNLSLCIGLSTLLNGMAGVGLAAAWDVLGGVLLGIPVGGDWLRSITSNYAIQRLQPSAGPVGDGFGVGVNMSVGGAILVLTFWSAAAIAASVWRTSTGDI